MPPRVAQSAQGGMALAVLAAFASAQAQDKKEEPASTIEKQASETAGKCPPWLRAELMAFKNSAASRISVSEICSGGSPGINSRRAKRSAEFLASGAGALLFGMDLRNSRKAHS
jgi:hypothetical protein